MIPPAASVALSTGGTAGVAVGVVAFVFVAIIIALVVFKRNDRSRRNRRPEYSPGGADAQALMPMHDPEAARREEMQRQIEAVRAAHGHIHTYTHTHTHTQRAHTHTHTARAHLHTYTHKQAHTHTNTYIRAQLSLR